MQLDALTQAPVIAQISEPPKPVTAQLHGRGYPVSRLTVFVLSKLALWVIEHYHPVAIAKKQYQGFDVNDPVRIAGFAEAREQAKKDGFWEVNKLINNSDLVGMMIYDPEGLIYFLQCVLKPHNPSLTDDVIRIQIAPNIEDELKYVIGASRGFTSVQLDELEASLPESPDPKAKTSP